MSQDISWFFLAVAVYCGHQAFLIDRQLRRLLPLRVERRWRAHPDWLVTALDPDRRLEPWVRFVLGPARWQRHLHGDRGAALVDRFWLLVGLTCLTPACLAVILVVWQGSVS